MYDEQFQRACENYHFNGGSSGAIAIAAILALSKIDREAVLGELDHRAEAAQVPA